MIHQKADEDSCNSHNKDQLRCKNPIVAATTGARFLSGLR